MTDAVATVVVVVVALCHTLSADAEALTVLSIRASYAGISATCGVAVGMTEAVIAGMIAIIAVNVALTADTNCFAIGGWAEADHAVVAATIGIFRQATFAVQFYITEIALEVAEVETRECIQLTDRLRMWWSGAGVTILAAVQGAVVREAFAAAGMIIFGTGRDTCAIQACH